MAIHFDIRQNENIAAMKVYKQGYIVKCILIKVL